MLKPEYVGSLQVGKGKVLKDYKFGEKLGQGAFGVVRYGWSKTNNKSCAIKIVDKTHHQFDLPSLEKEVMIMKKVNHPHCMRLYGVYDESDKTFMILELIQVNLPYIFEFITSAQFCHRISTPAIKDHPYSKHSIWMMGTKLLVGFRSQKSQHSTPRLNFIIPLSMAYVDLSRRVEIWWNEWA
mmetsp:Transcript_58193/g.153016  ORF Transcript_58193/g.153016 Transcript_58193/m.153016 type:complete len:183 (-) Transcript_58193:776-1324(-)